MLWTVDNAHKGGVSTIDLSNNFKFFVTGGVDGGVRVWEIRTRELITHLKEHTSKVTKVKILPDDINLYSAARDRSLLSWDLKNEKRTSNHTQRMGGINNFSIHPSDTSKVITIGQE